MRDYSHCELMQDVINNLPVCSRMNTIEGPCKRTATYQDEDGYFVCNRHSDPDERYPLKYAGALRRLRAHEKANRGAK